jgi:integrase
MTQLSPSRGDSPYCTTVAPRRLLGYVRAETGAGRWLALVEVGRGPSGAALRRSANLGQADDFAEADGTAILSYRQAFAAAANWQPDAPCGGKVTVRRAIESYVAGKRAADGEAAAEDARGRLALHVLREDEDGRPLKGPRGLGDRAVEELTLSELRLWRDGLVEGRSRATVNRVIANLKAALNAAFADEANGITSDSAWRRLERFRGADRRREDHFSEPEVARLIREARKQDPPFADLLTAAFHGGARHGELAALDVRHFDARRRTLAIPSGKTGARIVTLGEEGAHWFATIAGDRDPAEALLSPGEGRRWGPSYQHKRIKVALAAAGLPLSACFYTMRHSYISRAIERGMPLQMLAENVGTSVKMIEANYGKFLAATRRAMIERTAPRLRVVARAR